MLYNLFPKFKIVEINNVAALRMGHVIAQAPAKIDAIAKHEVKVGDKVVATFLENGVIAGLNVDAELVNYTAGQPCLIYTEELITADMTGGLDQFADEFVDGVVYPRALPLNLGDSFTTNNFKSDAAKEEDLPAKAYAVVENGILKVQESSTGALFRAVKTDLPAGQIAYEFTYVGKLA